MDFKSDADVFLICCSCASRINYVRKSSFFGSNLRLKHRRFSAHKDLLNEVSCASLLPRDKDMDWIVKPRTIYYCNIVVVHRAFSLSENPDI